VGNLIIEALPHDERELLQQRLILVDLNKDKILYEQGQPARDVYFPLDGLISCFATTL
jgi:CRP-like cAMP-binding protein